MIRLGFVFCVGHSGDIMREEWGRLLLLLYLFIILFCFLFCFFPLGFTFLRFYFSLVYFISFSFLKVFYF